jgi:hypothetical protein
MGGAGFRRSRTSGEPARTRARSRRSPARSGSGRAADRDPRSPRPRRTPEVPAGGREAGRHSARPRSHDRADLAAATPHERPQLGGRRGHVVRTRQELDGGEEQIGLRHRHGREEVDDDAVFGHGACEAVVEIGVALALRVGEPPIPALDLGRVAHRRAATGYFRRAAILVNCSNAASRSAAMTAGAGRESVSVRLLSLIQKRSRLSLSRLSRSS